MPPTAQPLRPAPRALALFLLLSVLLSPACARPAARQAERPAPPKRTPANVMSFEGADWLERPGREELEKPEVVIRAMGLEPGDVVAEIGTGTGFFARRLARAVAPGGKVYAVDIQAEMLELLREYAARDGIDNIVPVLGAEADPKLPAGQMEWILMVDVYHEFQQPAPMLAKIRAALAPGGRVALIEYRAEGESAAHINAQHRMSVEQVLAEWLPAGFELVERIETLPSQHLFVFQADRRGHARHPPQ